MLKKILIFVCIVLGLILQYNIKERKEYSNIINKSIEYENIGDTMLSRKNYTKSMLTSIETSYKTSKKLLEIYKKDNIEKIKELNKKIEGINYLKNAIFYENAGKIYFLKENKEKSKEQIMYAINYYEKGFENLRIENKLKIKQIKKDMGWINDK